MTLAMESLLALLGCYGAGVLMGWLLWGRP